MAIQSGPGVRVRPAAPSPARVVRPVKALALGPPARGYTLPVQTVQSIIMLLHGAPGSGKTTFGANIPHHYFMRCQEGTAFLKHRGDSVNSWEMYLARLDQFEALLVDPANVADYRTFVIDTVDDLFRLCTDYCARVHGFDHVSDLEFAKGYDMVRNEFHLGIARLCSLPVLSQRKINVVFLCQSEDREVTVLKGTGKYRTKIKLNIQQSTLPKTGKKVIIPLVDIIGYIRESGQPDKRIIEFEGNETLEAKDRTQGKLPPRILIGKDEGWKKITAYLEGRVRVVKKGGA